MIRQPGKFGKIFISYRRDGGSEMARLIMNELQQRGYNVFVDFEGLRSGAFNEGLLLEMKSATDVIVILSPRCLERCQIEGDWLRREIAFALKAQKNIITVRMRGFEWPEQPLPSDIQALRLQNSLAPTHEIFNASMERLTTVLIATPHRQDGSRTRDWATKLLFGFVVTCILIPLIIYVIMEFAPTVTRSAPEPAATPAPVAAGAVNDTPVD